MSSPGVHITVRPLIWFAIAVVSLLFGTIFFVIGLFVAPFETLVVTLLVLFGLCVAPFVWLLRLSRHW